MERDRNKTRSLILLNLSIVLFSFAGLFGKWIDLPSISLTFYRVLFSSMALGLFMLITRMPFRVSGKRDIVLLLLGGLLTTANWVSVFKAIQISTVGIGVITFSTFPLFVTFLEPLIFHTKLKTKNVIIAVIIIIGVLITVPELSLDNNIVRGILVGMVSPVAYALLSIVNKGLRDRLNGTQISFYEQLTAMVILAPFALTAGVQPTMRDVGLLIIFGVVTTAVAHTVYISCLKDVTAQFAGVCTSMETVYSIVFSMILLNEIPYFREVVGAVIITAAVIFTQITETKDS
ncbi:MAG: DMT family transporter [Clostridia bacterium]|nr:DMT family transporter [Clostridia bacterium]